MDFVESLETLSPRERQIVALAVNGLTDRAIQNQLEIRPGSLNTYWARIRKKLGGVSRIELATRITAERAGRQIQVLRAKNAELLNSINSPNGRSDSLRSERTLAIIRDMPDALLAFDEEGIIKISNPAAEELLGFDSGALLGLHLRVLVPQRYHGWHAEQRKQYEENPERRKMGSDGVNTATTRDGRETELVTTMNRCQVDDGHLIVCILRPLE